LELLIHILKVNKEILSIDLLPKMLDDMLKKFVDPYFQPKNVQDPDRTNLFELIYSPGNTVNSKEEVNTRRE